VTKWAPIPGYSGYEASDEGEVRSVPRTVSTIRGTWTYRGRPIRGGRDRKGRRMAAITSDDRVSRSYSIGTLVLMAHVGPRPTGLEVCHNNGDCSDDRLSNLRWDTHLENMRDIGRHGSHGNTKKTHCDHGHEFTPENTYMRIGSRHCRECMRVRSRAYMARRRAAAKAA
jgi:hypothetical protein